MLDGIRVFCSNLSENEKDFLLQTFNFSSTFCCHTWSEIGYNGNVENEVGMIWRHANHQYLKLFLGYKKNPLTMREQWSLKVIGSLHKFFKDGDNSGVFTCKEAVMAIKSLVFQLRITANRFKVTQIEFGANIPLENPAHEFIKSNLVRYGKYEFENFSSKGRVKLTGKEISLSQYRLKIYVKGEYILRVEVHWINLQELRSKGIAIKLLSDLSEDVISRVVNEKVITKLSDITSLEGIEIEDHKFLKKFSRKERETLLKFSNNIYLNRIELKMIRARENRKLREYEALRKQHKRGRDKFNSIIRLHGDGAMERIKMEIEKMSHF